MVEALEVALASAYRKNFAATGNVEVKICDEGIKVFSVFDVVDEVDDSKVEVTLREIAEEEGAEGLVVGDIYREDVTPDSFGRNCCSNGKTGYHAEDS